MLTCMRHISDRQRRIRLMRRHGLGQGCRYSDVVAATKAMTAWHATEAATVHLALWARVDGLCVDDVERALYVDRVIVKQLAMRRTLFAFGRDVLAAVWGSAAARTAAAERQRLAKDVEKAGIAADGAAWVDAACAAVLDRLADGSALPARDLREQLPQLSGMIGEGRPDKKWARAVPVGPRVLTLLGAEGRIMRAANGGHWRLNKPLWTSTTEWLGRHVPPPTKSDEGYAELVRRWLWTFGPGTEADIVWWLGATKTVVRQALADVAAEPVSLDGDGAGWVLPGDDAAVDPVEPSAVLLPTLDPTVMGWKQRDFYCPPDIARHVFDSNGNAGNTAWWDGRIVGAWVQDDDAVVRLELLERLPANAVAALRNEASRLTAWLDGVRITNVYKSPLMRGSPAP